MTDDLNKIVADLMEMRKGEAQGIMMMANSDDTMFEDCISRLKALAAHRPEEKAIDTAEVERLIWRFTQPNETIRGSMRVDILKAAEYLRLLAPLSPQKTP